MLTTRDTFNLPFSALCLAAAATASALVAGPAAAAAEEAGKAAVQAATRVKPSSGVVVAHTAPARMAVGETVVVRLQLSGISAPEGASVEVRDPATQTTLFSARLAQGEQRTVELPYAARADGMQFIHVTTTQAGRSTVHALALRVGSGEVKLKPQGQRLTTASGETVISLPAATPAPGR